MTTTSAATQLALQSLTVLPDDCVYEVFRHLSAQERWRIWPPPPPYSSYYNDQIDSHSQDDIHRSLNGMSLHYHGQLYNNSRGSSTSSDSKIPSPLEKLPDMHQPGQWYSTLHPPYELESWKEVYRERHDKDRIVRTLLDEMVEDSRNRIRHMDGISEMGMAHARDVLENIIAGRNGEAKNLSRTFYAQKTLKRLQRGWVLDQWRGYRSNHQNFPIWQGCGLMSMFSDQAMELSDIDRQFQELADEFLIVSPIPQAGSIGSISLLSDDGHDSQDSTESSPVYVGSNINSNNNNSNSSNYYSYSAGIDRYSPGPLMNSSSLLTRRRTKPSDRIQEHREEIYEQYQRHYDAQIERLKELIRFFTQEKGFKGNTVNYYDPFNSFIDKVLTRKVGIPISLCIVFAELAERVGVHGIELMGFPQHFMIRYRPLTPQGYHHGSSPLFDHENGPPAPPTFFLDLFHTPDRLLTPDEYEDYFTSLNIPLPSNIYRDLPTPPLEIFLRCLRNVVLAVEQTGGAGRIGSDHQTSLYSGITQLLALHPMEEWGLYVLWLKYLGNFWPEDVGFVRTAIEDMELSDHRLKSKRSGSTSTSSQPQQNQGRSAARSANHYTSSTQETIKILRAHVRDLEMTDEAGDVGEIRRRRRPKVAASKSSTSSASLSPDIHLASVQTSTTSTNHVGYQRGDSTPTVTSTLIASPTTSSPTMDNHASHEHHQYLRQSSVSGEQQNGSNPSMSSTISEEERNQSIRATSVFGGEERRRPEPEYYVGEVFRHLIYRYTGVIYGYDLKCEAEEGWIRSMGIDLLPHGRQQPFYNALLSDGSKRYVAQENIQVLFRELRQQKSNETESGPSEDASSSITAAATTTAAADQIPLDLASLLASAGATVVHPTSNSGSSTTTTTTTNTPTTATSSSTVELTDNATGTGTVPLSSILSNTTFAVYNIEFSELGPLNIEAVGQYFEAWDNKHGHYVMNKELRKVYPTEDYL
ncbi:hypothetical protein FBU30_008478 [Linnemannia zychae]|nr:hypothetical protein FBU30_008478 [Linnemannia zychae]